MRFLRDALILKPGFIIGTAILLCGFLFVRMTAAADTATDERRQLETAAAAKQRYEDRNALAIYEELLAARPDHPEALWNAAYLHIRLGWLDNEAGSRRGHYEKAHDYAARVFRRYPDSYEAHLVMGAAKAKLAEFLGSGEKVKTARELEQHARFLLNRRSDNPDVWYLYAWWHFEISRVSLADRFLAALLFGGLPNGASADQAIECLQKAIALKPDYSAYRHDLGVFYERTGNPALAREMYRAAIRTPPKAPEDPVFIEKARKRLARLDP
jgi:tetratricopeptide (TPR) repeat protein